MRFGPPQTAIALGAVLVSAACTGAIGEAPAVDPAAEADDTAGRINNSDDRLRHNNAGKLSTNGLVLDAATRASLSPAVLGGTWLSPTAITLSPDSPMAALATTDAGREMLRYLALCALASDVSLVLPGPEGQRLPGLYALAPAWADAPLDPGEQRWVSACLLAHANATGDAVWISLRGLHPGLAWDDAIAADFPIQEAAFYGNLFAAEPALYACIGRSLFNGSWATQGSYLHGRVCGVQPESCGLSQTGSCAPLTGDISGSYTAVCDIPAGETGGFGDCHTERPARTSPAFAEVITVYLAE